MEQTKELLQINQARMTQYNSTYLDGLEDSPKYGRLELIGGPMFSGKCLGKDTLVLMTNGYARKVQDIIVGDKLMGDDSKPRTVLSVSQGNGKLYTIYQSDGMDYIVNEDHILSLKNSCAYDEHNPLDKICDISVRDYLTTSDTFKKFYKGYRNSIKYNLRVVPCDFDPYHAGSRWEENCCIPDYVRFNAFYIRQMWFVGYVEKHCTWDFKSNSLEINILNFSKWTLSQFIDLARGLGLAVCSQTDGLSIKGNYLHELLWQKFRGMVSPPKEYDRNENLSSIKIAENGSGPYYGFTLDGNQRFMLADGTVTHNTTELLRRLLCDVSVKRSVLYINHSKDNRSTSFYSTHNPLYKRQLGDMENIVMINCSELPPLKDIVEYDTIGIDEGQFFETLDRAKEYADHGKHVIVAGLVGDAARRKFGTIVDLIPIAEDYTSLYALCVKCAENRNVVRAAFTFKIAGPLTVSSEQVDVGGADKYIPVCRRHHLELSAKS